MPATLPEPRRGQVWLATLDKRRPVVILTRDPLGRYLHSVIAAPVTSTIRGLTTEVAVGPDEGIRARSVVNLDNVQLVPRSSLVRHVGDVGEHTMSAICAALAVAVDCEA